MWLQNHFSKRSNVLCLTRWRQTHGSLKPRPTARLNAHPMSRQSADDDYEDTIGLKDLEEETHPLWPDAEQEPDFVPPSRASRLASRMARLLFAVPVSHTGRNYTRAFLSRTADPPHNLGWAASYSILGRPRRPARGLQGSLP